MKLAIIGSRTCPAIDIGSYLKYIPDVIVSGGAKGADTYAREFAKKNGLKLIEYFPNYDKQMSQGRVNDINTKRYNITI